MKAKVEIDAGICGFQTTANVTSEDGQAVKFDIDTDCDKIRQLGQILQEKGAIDAYQEISPSHDRSQRNPQRLLCRLCSTSRIIQGYACCRRLGFTKRH